MELLAPPVACRGAQALRKLAIMVLISASERPASEVTPSSGAGSSRSLPAKPSHSLPVVGARAGGVPDVIAEGQDGILVRFGDVPALAAAVGDLLRDQELARRLGAAGRAKVLRELTWDQIYARVWGVYDEVKKRKT